MLRLKSLIGSGLWNRVLPIKDYPKLTISQINDELKSLSPSQIREIRSYEVSHQYRKSVVTKLDRQLTS